MSMPELAAAPVLPPTRIAQPAILGCVIIGATVGGFAMASATLPLGSGAIAPATVVVDGSRKTVQHLEGGTVRVIHVHDGDQVAAGDQLVTLDDTRLSAAMATLQPQLAINLAQTERLRAERVRSATIDFSADLTSMKIRELPGILADQRLIFQARQAALEGRRRTLTNQREQALASSAGLKNRIRSQRKRIELTQEEYAGVEKLASRGVSPKLRLVELSRAIAELESQKADLDARLIETGKQADFAPLEIERAEAVFTESIETELQRVEQERYDLIERIDATQEQLQRLEIRAPVAGTVVSSMVHTIGGILDAGAPIMEIVPKEDTLVVEAHVQPVDIDEIVVGMSAQIRLLSIEAKLLPPLQGEVTRVSADRLVDPTSQVPYYLVRVRVTDSAASDISVSRLRPGIPVEVALTKRPKTLFDYLLGWFVDLRAHALRE